jgi:thioredoxin reductase
MQSVAAGKGIVRRGQLKNVEWIENYPGFSEGIFGTEGLPLSDESGHANWREDGAG